MINILNEARDSYCKGNPILSDNQYSARLNDLKEFEKETDTMYINSPNCDIDIQSITQVKIITGDRLKECNDIHDIIEYSNQNNLIACAFINGLDMIATYVNGYLTKVQFDYIDDDLFDKIKSSFIPYKINKDGIYIVKGNISFKDKPIFYVKNVVEGYKDNYIDNLKEASEIGFDIIPFWTITNLSTKNIQNVINYVFEYVEEENISTDGIVFRINDVKNTNFLNYDGCFWWKH